MLNERELRLLAVCRHRVPVFVKLFSASKDFWPRDVQGARQAYDALLIAASAMATWP
jgi:hypothetical protein